MITQKPVRRRLARTAAFGFAALLVSTFPLAARSAHGGGGSSHSSHSSGGGRSAHSASGGGSHGSSGSHGGSGSFHGGGHGGFHGGRGGRNYFFYPGFGWGFWPGLSFWWDEPYYPYYDPYYYRAGEYGYGYGYDGGGYAGGGGGGYDRSELGALDLDVSPGRTHVFVNGEDLGIVDKYDGWPGYLWLPRGTYDIAFYLDGYKTIARQVTVSPGSVFDIDDKMEQGTSVRPEDLASKTHQRRDDRVQYERWRRQQLEKQGYNSGDDEEWRDRVHRPQGPQGAPPQQQMDDEDDDGNPPPPPPRMDRRMGPNGHRPGPGGQQGYLRLTVEPDDASVYLDGRFVGTGSDLSMLRGGLAVPPGHHQLSVVRPGRKAEEKDFDVKAGEDLKVDVELAGGSR